MEGDQLNQGMNGHGISITSGSNSQSISKSSPAPHSLKPSTFSVRNFVENIMGHDLNFEVLKVDSSLYVWIGSSSNILDNMSLSMPTRFNSQPLVSNWFGTPEFSAPLSQKLSAKLKKPVIVSFNVNDHHAVPHVERALFNDIRQNVDAY